MIVDAILSTLLIITYPIIDKEHNMGGDGGASANDTSSPGSFGNADFGAYDAAVAQHEGQAQAVGQNLFSQSGAEGREGPLGPLGSYTPTQETLSYAQTGEGKAEWEKAVEYNPSLATRKTTDVTNWGTVMGLALGLATPVPTALATKYGEKMGDEMGWKSFYEYDPEQAEQYAQEFVSQYEGGGQEKDDFYQKATEEIRDAKTEVEAEPVDVEAELVAEKDEAAERATRLGSGRKGLLWQGDESGVNTKLGGN